MDQKIEREGLEKVLSGLFRLEFPGRPIYNCRASKTVDRQIFFVYETLIRLKIC